VLIDGGPMMGRLERNLDAPVTKTCKAILVLPEDHPVVISKIMTIDRMLKQALTACCHCSMCSELCPRNLLGHNLFPDKLMRLAAYNSTCDNDAAATTAYLCCECRLCEYSCVMQLQPWKLNHELKIRLKNAGIPNPHKNVPESVHDFREYRRYPTDKLVRQLGISEYYHVDAPLKDYGGTIESVVLPLRQHFGAAAKPLVKEGSLVKKGDIIADMGEGELGAPIHASIDGTIGSVSESLITIKR
jgi:Na+-translocating ferredoxin:NAD+ oxidoreductase RnfC subunit